VKDPKKRCSVLSSGERARLARWRWRLAIADFLPQGREGRSFRRDVETSARDARFPEDLLQTRSLCSMPRRRHCFHKHIFEVGSAVR
jgi:hypothetical protein